MAILPDAYLVDVHFDGVFYFEPLRYENGIVYHLRVGKDKMFDYYSLRKYLEEQLETTFYAMFFKLPDCELQVGLKIIGGDVELESMYGFAETYGKVDMCLAHIPHKLEDYYIRNLCFDDSCDEVTAKLRINGIRKKDAGNMSWDELVGWAEEEAQHLHSPLKPRTARREHVIEQQVSSDMVVDETQVNDAPEVNDESHVNDSQQVNVDEVCAEHSGAQVNKVVDKGKGIMIDEGKVPKRKSVVRKAKGIVIQENVNPSVMDHVSSDSESEVQETREYSMDHDSSDSDSEYSDKSIDYLSEGEVELIELRKRKSIAKRAPKTSKQRACSDENGCESSSRQNRCYDDGDSVTIMEHEEFMEGLMRNLRQDEADLTDPFKIVEVKLDKYPIYDVDTHWRMRKPKVMF